MFSVEQCPVYCILYSCSGEYNLSLSGPASSPARKQSQCCPARLGQGQGWFLDWRLAGGAAGPGLGPNSLLTLVDVALQAPVLLRSDTATCDTLCCSQGGKSGPALLCSNISNGPSQPADILQAHNDIHTRLVITGLAQCHIAQL